MIKLNKYMQIIISILTLYSIIQVLLQSGLAILMATCIFPTISCIMSLLNICLVTQRLAIVYDVRWLSEWLTGYAIGIK